MAKENLKNSQRNMKIWYDKKAKTRKFQVGDQVLVLFPIIQNPLQARFHGPYTILSKVNDLNYIIETPDRRKPRQLCHVNMLKPYFDKKIVAYNKEEPPPPPSNQVDTKEDVVKIEDIPCKLSNSDVINNLDAKLSSLTPSQRTQIKSLIHKYIDIFPDVPRRTNIAIHDVDVGDSKPIKQHPYRMSPEKTLLAEKEVEYMLENDIIQSSNSNWSSPCILVLKPDGSVRFCTDYRKVNNVTKTDAYPIPRIDDCIDKIAKSNFLTKIDLVKGYWCVPLSDRAREISAFVTPSGLYEYKVLPFGMKNAPATFQRMMNGVVKPLPNTDVYIDDLITGVPMAEQV